MLIVGIIVRLMVTFRMLNCSCTTIQWAFNLRKVDKNTIKRENSLINVTVTIKLHTQ